jgi:hypothetical protein
MNYLIAHRAYESDHGSFRMKGNVNQLPAFRAYPFFAGVNLIDSYGLAATVAMEFHLGRFIGYEPDAIAFGAVNLPACEFVADVDFLTA